MHLDTARSSRWSRACRWGLASLRKLLVINLPPRHNMRSRNLTSPSSGGAISPAGCIERSAAGDSIAGASCERATSAGCGAASWGEVWSSGRGSGGRSGCCGGSCGNTLGIPII